ncbi:MAG: glycoside hydrolase family 5 protein [Fibrobacteria bacterium]
MASILRNLVASALFFSSLASASFLHKSGNRLLNAENKEVRLTGVNWFGLETSNLSPHGLWARDWKGMLLDVRDMGFNCIRIPYCDKIFEPGAVAGSITTFGTEPKLGILNGSINADLQGKSPLEILDIIVDGCGKLGLKVILDNHSRAPDGYIEEKIWYTAKVPEEKWIANWVAMATRYKGNSTVIACDLDNEPHGSTASGGAQWGTDDPAFDWRLAAQKCGNAVLQANPDVLIIVEGVEQVGSKSYWWGGNLTGATSDPITLSKPEKLIYSAHEYGPEVFAQPWFTDAAFPGNMTAIWDANFGYLSKNGTSPIFVGEFGLRDAKSNDGKAGIWMENFLKYMGTGYSWTFWCLNPNSGDTGGLLASDWRTPEQWKLDLLKPYQAPLVDGPGPGFSGIRQARGPTSTGALRQSGNRLSFSIALTKAHRLAIYSLAGKPMADLAMEASARPSIVAPRLAPGLYLAKLTGPERHGTWILSE